MINKRILIDNQVYIPYNTAIEILKEQGIDPGKELQTALVSKCIDDDFKLMLPECDFNAIVKEHFPNKPLLIQFTHVDSLAVRTDNIRSIYPLKMMFAKEMFLKKAAEHGMGLEEYEHAFKIVEFAIYCGNRDTENYRTFANKFGAHYRENKNV